MESREVRIGGSTFGIQAFSPRKVLIAGRTMKQLGGVLRTLSRSAAAYRKEYREENAQVVTRSMAAVPPWRDALSFMTAEDWEKAGGQIELRNDPSEFDMIAHLFGEAFELAEEDLLRLLALVLVPNQELRDAARAGEAKVKLDEYAERFIDDATMGELIDLVDTTVSIVTEEMQGKAAPLRRIRAAFGIETAEAEETPGETSETQSSDPQGETSTTKSSSSTPSPAPTDGDTERSSMRPPIESSEPSLTE